MAVVDFLKDRIFPYFCANCGREGEWWCEECRGKIKPFSVSASTIEKVTALFSYSDNKPLEKLIREFKYDYVRDIAELWREILRAAQLTFVSGVVFIPVPLHDKRLRERGFNQAEVLSRILSEIYQRPQLKNLLQRTKATSQQARMTREERLDNVAGAFAWTDSSKAPEHVVLIDDVFTTGATMEECAKVLRHHGTQYIEALVLAHG